MTYEHALLILAFVVFYGLLCRKNMWGCIVVYWLVLTIKNFMDLLAALS